jgi:hypothetical protein
MSQRCEDYPCCGHTDGLGCNWTPDYSNPHFLCDHENGECEVANMLDDIFEEDECDPHNSVCVEGDEPCRECKNYWLDFHADGMEDAWLDGSYEE